MGWSSGKNPDISQLANALEATGVVARTIPRSQLPSANTAVLTTQKASFQGIYIAPNVIVTSANISSATTAAGTPTNYWFALYDSSLNVIRQSTDQLTAAWAANTLKTLTLDSIPVTAGSRSASTTVTLTIPTLSQALSALIAVNDSVVVSNANIAAYNGTFTVTAVTATTITYTAGSSATDSLAAPFPTVQLAAGKRTFTTASGGMYYVCMMVKATTVPSILGMSNQAAGSNITGLAPVLRGDDATNVTLTGTAVSPAAALTASAAQFYAYLS